MTPLLEVKNLQVDFIQKQQKVRHAVLGVNFILNKGETLGIVGETGCGKSAVAKAIVKLFPKHTTHLQGEVLFKEKNLLLASEKELQSIRGQEIGMIFQDPMTSLNPTMNIGLQILEGYRRSHPHLSKKEALLKITELLEWVGVQGAAERIHDYPHTLSGGMRQRVMIAIALASNPKILIADEPTTALDVTVQAQILSLFKSIQKKLGMSTILITHDLSVVAGSCDRVLVMYAGRVVESALVEDLFYRPKHPYTKKLLEAAPKLHGRREESLIPIEGIPPDGSFISKGCSFYPRCKEALSLCKLTSPPLIQIASKHHTECWLHAKDPL